MSARLQTREGLHTMCLLTGHMCHFGRPINDKTKYMVLWSRIQSEIL